MENFFEKSQPLFTYDLRLRANNECFSNYRNNDTVCSHLSVSHDGPMAVSTLRGTLRGIAVVISFAIHAICVSA